MTLSEQELKDERGCVIFITIVQVEMHDSSTRISDLLTALFSVDSIILTVSGLVEAYFDPYVVVLTMDVNFSVALSTANEVIEQVIDMPYEPLVCVV